VSGSADEARELRIAWLSRGVYALLAFDAWMLLVLQATAHGVTDFDLAHFGFLRPLERLPQPELYLVCVLLTGWLALCCALGAASFLLRAGVWLFYTLAWSQSQLDVFQHHYFLSILLGYLPFVNLRGPGHRRARDLFYRGMLANLGLVYGFAAASKLEPFWISGDVLRHLEGLGSLLRPVVAACGAWLPAADCWSAAALGVAAAEGVGALAYGVAAWGRTTRLALAARWIGLLSIVAFHVVVELGDLKIRWFSWYALLAAALLLSGSAPITALARRLRAPWRRLQARLDAVWWRPGRAFSAAALVLGFALVPLPGAWAAGALALAFCALHPSPEWMRRQALAAVVLCLTVWLADVPFRFHTLRSQNFREVGETAEAMRALVRARGYDWRGNVQRVPPRRRSGDG